MEFNVQLTQKELWMILKSLGKLRVDESAKLIEKIIDLYTEQRLLIASEKIIPTNTGD